MKQSILMFLLLFTLAGCGTPAAPIADVATTTIIAPPTTISVATAPATPTARTLIDPQQPLTSAADPQWQYQRSATADFDGDGVAERAVLIALAEVVDGQPLWDDGQPWQVYVEEPDGTRTSVYARFVQLGTLEALLTSAAQAHPGITLLELRVMPDDSSRGPHFAHHLHRRQLAKRVQLVEGAMAALDHLWNDIVAPVTDGPFEH